MRRSTSVLVLAEEPFILQLKIAEDPLGWRQLHSHSSRRERSRCTQDTKRVFKTWPLDCNAWASQVRIATAQPYPGKWHLKGTTCVLSPARETVWVGRAWTTGQPGESCQSSMGQGDPQAPEGAQSKISSQPPAKQWNSQSEATKLGLSLGNGDQQTRLMGM